MRRILPLLALLSACAPLPDDADLPDGVETASAALGAGAITPDTRVAVGAGTFKDPATGATVRRSITMITNELAVVPAAVAPSDLTVTLGGKTRKLLVARQTTPTNGDLVVAQLTGALLLGTPPIATNFKREFAATAPKVGASLYCYGIGGIVVPDSVGSMLTTVKDIVGDELSLEYKNAGSSAEDIGGYCEAADSARLVAIITASLPDPQQPGAGQLKARLVDKVVKGLPAVRAAIDFGWLHNAVSFVDGANQAIQAPLVRLPRDPARASQGFYLIDDANPPQGGQWYFLVSAKDGLCLTTNGMQACDFQSDSHRWTIDSNSNGDTLIVNRRGEWLMPGPGSVVFQWPFGPPQRPWRIFANRY